MSLKELLFQQLEENDRTRAKPSKPKAKAGEREVHFDRDPAFAATWVASQIREPSNPDPDTATNLPDIEAQIKALQNGDMSQLEGILYSQVISLNCLFADCITRSARMRANAKTKTSTALANDLAHLALRSQDNCRKTIATLAEMKNPKRTTFIKRQQNLLVAGQPDAQQLPEAYGSEAMDARAARSTERDCLEVEAVAAIDGTKDTRRQTKKRSKLA